MCSSVHTGDRLTQIENMGYNSEIWLRGVHLLVSEASATTGITLLLLNSHVEPPSASMATLPLESTHWQKDICDWTTTCWCAPSPTLVFRSF